MTELQSYAGVSASNLLFFIYFNHFFANSELGY